MKTLSIEGSNGFSTFAIPMSDNINALIMTGTAKSLTVPAGAKIALFSGNDDYYVEIGSTAAVPTADVVDGTASELKPAIRSVAPGQVISVIGATGVVTVSFYG